MIAEGARPSAIVGPNHTPAATATTEAKRRFALLPESEQRHWKRQAAAQRAAAKARPAPIDLIEFPDPDGLCPGGPLGLSSRDGLFPMRPAVVVEALGAKNFAARVSDWTQEHQKRA